MRIGRIRSAVEGRDLLKNEPRSRDRALRLQPAEKRAGFRSGCLQLNYGVTLGSVSIKMRGSPPMAAVPSFVAAL
jgi:hypothetical protein